MIDRAKITDKTTVLINGATGGVGTAVIQLLKLKKYRIIARISYDGKEKLLKKLGDQKVFGKILIQVY